MEILAALLLGGFFAFNALASPARVGKAAEKALRRQFPGASVHVQVRGKAGHAVLKGRFQSVNVELGNAHLGANPLASQAAIGAGAAVRPASVGSIGRLEVHLRDWSVGDLPVKSTDIVLRDVRYDFGALKRGEGLRLISFADGKVALAVQASALLPTFARRAPEIVNPHVELRDGEIILSGRREFLGTDTSIVVRGPLVARGQELDIEPARAEVGGAALPPALAAPILRGVNPVYSFEALHLPFNLAIESAKAGHDTLEIAGTLSLP